MNFLNLIDRFAAQNFFVLFSLENVSFGIQITNYDLYFLEIQSGIQTQPKFLFNPIGIA